MQQARARRLAVRVQLIQSHGLISRGVKRANCIAFQLVHTDCLLCLYPISNISKLFEEAFNVYCVILTQF